MFNDMNDMLYWFWIIAAFILTLVIAFLIMKKTNKFGLSFGISTVVNVLITSGGFIWLLLGESDETTKFKLVVYGIAFVNLLIISAFVVLSMRSKSNASVPHSVYKD